MKMDKTLCYCMKVKIGDVADAVDNGATTFEEVQEATNVGRGCKRCVEDAKRVIEELLLDKQ